MFANATAAGIAARECSDILLKVAATRAEREDAFRLTYDAYAKSGLCQFNEAELRFTPHQLLPTTDILIAQSRDEVICTLSLARDGELGLPMETLYPDEVSERRARGLQLAEVTCLADRRENPRRFFGMFCELSRLMVQLAEKSGIDQILITVHPRHAALYRRYMAFEMIGERRDYATVQDNPAVALCLDLNQIRENRPPRWNQFFGAKIPDEVLRHQPISWEDREYFENLLARESCSRPARNDHESEFLAQDAFTNAQHQREDLVCV